MDPNKELMQQAATEDLFEEFSVVELDERLEFEECCSYNGNCSCPAPPPPPPPKT